MNTIVRRYAEDPTGVNPDNLVSGEIHELNERPVRAVVPTYGLFFTESLRVYDFATMRPLTKNVDYRVPIINQEASLRFGKEIGDVILIENTDVSSKIAITYQVLGGAFQSNISNVVAVFETWLNDNRGTEWVSGVFGKPTEYPPAPHPHNLDEMFGWESFSFVLERIAQAIMMGNTSVFDDLLKAIDRKEVTEPEIDGASNVAKIVTLRRLLYSLKKLNFNTILLTPESYFVRRDQDLWVDVRVTNMNEDQQLYWTIEHDSTLSSDFLISSGVVNLVNGTAKFRVTGKKALSSIPDRLFRICIRTGGAMGPVLSKSYPINLRGYVVRARTRLMKAMTHPTVLDPRTNRTAGLHYISHSYELAKAS